MTQIYVIIGFGVYLNVLFSIVVLEFCRNLNTALCFLTCKHIDCHIHNLKVFSDFHFSVLFLFSELVGESVLSIQSSEKVTSISLPPTPPYHTLEFQLEVLCVIPSGTDRPANERLTNGEVRHRPRSYSHPDTPMTAIDQRVRHSN